MYDERKASIKLQLQKKTKFSQPLSPNPNGSSACKQKTFFSVFHIQLFPVAVGGIVELISDPEWRYFSSNPVWKHLNCSLSTVLIEGPIFAVPFPDRLNFVAGGHFLLSFKAQNVEDWARLRSKGLLSPRGYFLNSERKQTLIFRVASFRPRNELHHYFERSLYSASPFVRILHRRPISVQGRAKGELL